MKAIVVIETKDGKDFNIGFNYDAEGSNRGIKCAVMQHIINVTRAAALQAIEYINKGKIVLCPPASVQDEMIKKEMEQKQ